MLNVSSCLGVIYDNSLFHEPLLCAQSSLLCVVAVSQGLGPGLCGSKDGRTLGFLAGIFEASLLKHAVVQFSLVLLGQLGFVGPGKKLFPSLACSSCRSDLLAALR